MLIFPLGTDRRLKRTPWVNYGLIATNVLIFMLPLGAAVQELVLYPGYPRPFQFITYQFLHGGPMHLISNMIFLWVFGNAVEERLGRVGYLLFYLSAGVFAGIGHVLVESASVLGASGSVAGVSGAFLVFFALSRVTIFYWLIIVGAFRVPGVAVIAVFVVIDALMYLGGASGVAYLAHLTGYAFGMAVAIGLLLARVLARDPSDLFSLIDRWRRRSTFKRMTRGGYQPWDYARPDEPDARAAPPPLDEQQQQLMRLRSEVHHALAAHDVPHAANAYSRLLQADASQVLAQQNQLDVANALMSQQRYDLAARAYELFLTHYPSYPQRESVELILGLIYARYLDQQQRARELLNHAIKRLDGSDRDLAQQVLAELPD